MYDINAYNTMMAKLKGGIIVSCQSKEGDPTHCPEFMAAFAKAAEIGGAAGIRANSVVDIEAIKKSILKSNGRKFDFFGGRSKVASEDNSSGEPESKEPVKSDGEKNKDDGGESEKKEDKEVL